MILCRSCQHSRWIYIRRGPLADELRRLTGLTRYNCQACGHCGWHFSRRKIRVVGTSQRMLVGWRLVVVAIALGICVLLVTGFTLRAGSMNPVTADDLVRSSLAQVAREKAAATGAEPVTRQGAAQPPISGTEAARRRQTITPPHTTSRQGARPRPPAATARRFHGSLAIASDPLGAVVSVDGRVVGATPLRLKAVPIGSRVVRIESQGYERSSFAARVVANKEVRVAATLQRGSEQ